MPDFARRIVFESPGMSSVVVRRDLPYRGAGDAAAVMDVYIPPAASVPLLPLALFVHGGPMAPEHQPKDWGVYRSYGELVAASGLAAATFNYRFHHPSELDQAQDDINAAIAYVRAHAAEWHADPERLCLWVFSGGASSAGW